MNASPTFDRMRSGRLSPGSRCGASRLYSKPRGETRTEASTDARSFFRGALAWVPTRKLLMETLPVAFLKSPSREVSRRSEEVNPPMSEGKPPA